QPVAAIPDGSKDIVLVRKCRRFFAVMVCAFGVGAGLAALPAAPALAQATGAVPAGVTAPDFFDPKRRPQRPDLTRIKLIRFITETDYPPFNYAGPDGNPTGFNVDLARMICEEIQTTCTVQM